MRVRNPGSHILSACTALAVLAACSGGTSLTAPSPLSQIPIAGSPNGSSSQGLPRFNAGDANAPGLIFASLPQSNTVDIFSQGRKHKMVGQITTGLNSPLGLATDATGNLYVANQNVPTVPVYAPPYTGAPFLTLDAAGNLPQGVAVSAHGVVAALNYCNTSSCDVPYVVSFYAKGSTKLCVTVPVSGNGIDGIAEGGSFDDAGNLYLVGQVANSPDQFIGEIKGGCKAKKTVLLTTNTALGHLSDVHVDKADRIAILGLDSSIIDTYNPPKHGSLGSPVSTTTLGGSSGAFSFAFLASGQDLYANIDLAGAYEYAYPAGGAPESQVKLANIGSVTVSPPLIP
jgi:hypothetical protein